MTHRAETVVDTVKQRLTGLTTTGARVYRGRLYHLRDSDFPGLLIFMGGETIVSESNQNVLDCELTLNIEGCVRSSDETQLETLLNVVREEVTIKLQEDYTQGLAFAIDTREGDASPPEFSNEGERPEARQRWEWIITYRRNKTDPGA